MFVIVAEYGLMRYVLRFLKGREPTERHLKHWYNRTRGTGSSLSTVRMMLRLFSSIGAVKFFVEQLVKHKN